MKVGEQAPAEPGVEPARVGRTQRIQHRTRSAQSRRSRRIRPATTTRASANEPPAEWPGTVRRLQEHAGPRARSAHAQAAAPASMPQGLDGRHQVVRATPSPGRRDARHSAHGQARPSPDPRRYLVGVRPPRAAAPLHRRPGHRRRDRGPARRAGHPRPIPRPGRHQGRGPREQQQLRPGGDRRRPRPRGPLRQPHRRHARRRQGALRPRRRRDGRPRGARSGSAS